MQNTNQGLAIMKNQKAMLKTAEALIAIVITLIFIVLVFSQTPAESMSEKNLDMLKMIHVSDEFRNCATAENLTCISALVNDSMPRKYDFYVDMSPHPSAQPSGLPEKGIYVESLIIAGNVTDYNPQIIRLYYWMK